MYNLTTSFTTLYSLVVEKIYSLNYLNLNFLLKMFLVQKKSKKTNKTVGPQIYNTTPDSSNPLDICVIPISTPKHFYFAVALHKIHHKLIKLYNFCKIENSGWVFEVK